MLTKAGGPEALQPVELAIEEPGSGELRVRVRAAGVGSTDLLMLAGKYRYAPSIPFVPGYEVAGVVDAIGPGVTGFKIGQRVGNCCGLWEPQPTVRRRPRSMTP
jgi:NADPH:quinone reductase